MTALSPELRARLQDLTTSDRVVVFMKGNRQQPRCGFSATVVEILDELLPSYTTVDVLADNDVREGIKAFSDWPTIPQLYVGGEFVGGCDIVKDLYALGELHTMFGQKKTEAGVVVVTITPAAAGPLKAARDGEAKENQHLRLSVNGRFQHGLSFGPELPGDVKASSEGIEIRIDAASAKRANGVVIDFVTAPQSGFKIENPNEPPRVKGISVKELKTRMDTLGDALRLYDVRTPDEHDKANIKGAVLVNDAVRAQIATLPKDTPLYFHCHHGGRSQAAAEHWVAQGFKTVFNVEGGIEAWSSLVDNSVPRY
ncbi:MAG TPA: Grx4 family monothiol glutaredoxin [Myxococcota bacterium]